MKSSRSLAAQNSRKRFWSLRSFNGAACSHKKTAALLAGSTFLAAGAYAQNTSETVANNAAIASPGPSLNAAATYTGTGTVPTSTTDIIFSNQTYLQTVFNGTGLTAGSINDLSPTALTITTGNTGTATSITLSGGDSVSGNTADLLYVASNSNLTINGGSNNLVAVILGASGNFDAVGTLTVSAALSGSNALTKTGTGTLILSGTNSTAITGGGTTYAVFSGGVTISAGTLQVGSGGTNGSLGTGTGTITDNGTLAFNLSSNLTVGNVLTGTGGLTQAGTGITTLTGTNNYSGATAVNAGVLNVASLASLPNSGAGTTVAAGGTLAAATVSDANALLATATFVAGSALGFDTTAGGYINNTSYSGTYGLTKIGTNTLTLTGANTYTGPTTINNGTLVAGGAGTLPSTGAINFSGSGTLSLRNEATGTIAQGNNINLTSNGATATIDVGNNGGANTGSTVAFGALSLGTAATGIAGQFNFTASNNYLETFTSLALTGGNGGTTTLNPTTTSVTIGNVTNPETGGGGTYDTLTLGGTSTGNLITGVVSGPTTGADTRITKSGTSTWILTGANTYTGPTTISSGTLQLGNGGTTGSLSTSSTITDTGTLVFNRSNTVLQGRDFSGAAITGTAGALTQAGTGTLILTAANTYTGATLISAGTLQLGVGGATTGALSASGTIVDNGTLVFNRTNAVTQGTDFSASAITGTGALTQLGTGTLTLTAANTYAGTTTVTAGTLALTGNTTTAASITSANAALSLGGGTLSYAPAVNGAASTGLTQTFASTAATAGHSTVAVSAGNTVALGAITRTAGAMANFNPASTTGVVTTTNPTSSLVNGLIGTWATTGNGSSSFYRFATINGSGQIVGYGGGTTATTQAAVTDTTGTVNYDLGNYTAPAAGDMLGANASVNTLRVLFPIAGGAIAGNFTANGLLNAGFGQSTYTGQVTIGANQELNIGNSGAGVAITGNVVDNAAGASSLVYGGPGATTLALSGTNTYTGGTTINAGVVSLGSTGALGTTGAIALSGGTLQFTAANTVDYSSRFSTKANQTFSFDTNGQNVTFASSFGGTNSMFTKVGTGTLTLGGANTFGTAGQTFAFGATNVNLGTIVLANPTALGLYTTISEPGTGTATDVIALSGNNTYNYTLLTAGGRSGVGLSNVALQNLSGNNTFAGTITLNANNAGPIIESDAGTLTLGSLTFSAAFLNRRDFTFTGVGNSVITGTYASGYLGFTQAGTGTTTFTGAATGSSTGFTVNSGTMAVTGNATTVATIGSFGGLNLGGGTLSYAPSINGTASTGQTLTTGNTTVSAGYSAVNVSTGNTVALGTVTRAAATGGMLDINPTGAGTATTSTTTLVNGLFLGPYTSVGSGTGLSYATRAATGTVAITAAVGTAAADATGVTSTAGTVNYNLAAGGAVGAGASFNTLRYTGADNTATPVTGAFTANGVMNAGTGGLTINSGITPGTAAAPELVITSNGQAITLNGAIGNGVNLSAATTASVVTYGGPGAGVLTLTGTNTYTGATFVNAGTLLNNGTVAGAVNVNPNATLGGTGTIAGAVAVGTNAVITGGTVGTVGTLTLSNTLTLTGLSGAPANYLVDISGATSDSLKITGAFTLSTAAGAVETLTFSGTPVLNTKYVLATYASIGTGRFVVTNLPAGATLVYGNTELDLMTVPEPATWAGGLLCVGLLGLAQRRRAGAWLRLARA